MDRKELISEIDNRFYLILTLSIFLPVLLYYMGKAVSKTEEEAAQALLQSSSLIGVYLLNYILFQTQKTRTTNEALKRIGDFMLISMVPIVILVLSMGIETALKNSYTTLVLAILFVASVYVLLASPLVLEFLILFGGNKDKPLDNITTDSKELLP